MRTWEPGFVPPHCPRPSCPHHRQPVGRWFVSDGHHLRQAFPHRIRRFRCLTCHRSFSTQTFDTTYWLKRPDLQPEIFRRLVECSALRQSARGLGVAPSTVQRQAERLGRHCLLEQRARAGHVVPGEPVVLDGFQTFEYSQFWPCDFNVCIGSRSQFFYGFTDAELRRSGRMTAPQRRKRRLLERRHGRPDPRATEKAVADLVTCIAPSPMPLTVLSDEHAAYPRAFARLPGHAIEHRTTSSRKARIPQNPLHPANLVDLLIRHCGANHKRETIAFSKRRQAIAERLAVFQVWRNFMKLRSERRPRQSQTPAMALGLESRPLTVEDVLDRRRFPSLVELPERQARYYWRLVPTRQIPTGRRHELKYAA